jgi:hypothetical protein
MILVLIGAALMALGTYGLWLGANSPVQVQPAAGLLILAGAALVGAGSFA